MAKATIYHNPACGTSRNALAALEAAGLDAEVVQYLKVGWTKPQLKSLLAAMKLKPREVLRPRGAPPEAVALVGEGASDEAVLDAMVRYPILVERPIVTTAKGTRLCRPSERVQELLP
jgi:arsenate reductase (glutaredoxin)